MTEQNKQLTSKKGDSRARVISGVALGAVILLLILVVVAVVAAVVFGIRVDNRLGLLEEQLDRTDQVSTEFEEYKTEVDSRLTALEGAEAGIEPQFEVSNFTLTSEVTEYDYIDDYVYYEGQGTITLANGSGTNYLVVLKQILVSGGGSYSESDTYKLISVVDGSGEFSTYDSGTVIEMDEPVYDFEIVGYITIND